MRLQPFHFKPKSRAAPSLIQRSHLLPHSMESETLIVDPAELDDNGFPLSPSYSSSGIFSDASNSNISVASNGSTSFAADFYSSGADWSSLMGPSAAAAKEKSSLVQRDLFQMWGIEKPIEEPRTEVPNRSKQMNLFQMWGMKKPQEGSGSGSTVSPLSPPAKRRRAVDGVLPAGDYGEQIGGKGAGGGNARPRGCPFYKKITGTPFTVDAFRYGQIDGCSAYFLSHFHSDHYGGLTKKWAHGTIYCTPLTARLVTMCLSVNPLYICSLELDTEYVIDGIKVTLLEANHCPGAALIYFSLSDGRRFLHTGDFRACKMMQSHPLLVNQHINTLYLDTTYCNPKYRFPAKEDVVNFVVKTTRNCLSKQPKTLIVVGAYSIGKEHVYVAISQTLGVPIYTDASRRRILQSFGWPQLSGKLCSHGQNSPLHVLPLSSLRHESLKEYLNSYKQQFTEVLAFRPTGWTFSEKTGSELGLIRPSSKGNVTIYGVPYSEHSSFTELRDFVKFLRPEKIIPTVNNGNAAARDQMQSYFREWLKCRDSENELKSNSGAVLKERTTTFRNM